MTRLRVDFGETNPDIGLLFLDPAIQFIRIFVKRLRIRFALQRRMHRVSSERVGRDAGALSKSGSIGPITGTSHARCRRTIHSHAETINRHPAIPVHAGAF
ncbi:hypothetical protein [Burkholderia latens]|uniref:Uncharacterized protein n=1 Tax=Burkholderia latens TaxID=488446 RepID=A0A6H9SLB9_9BURK|nr:hypothetical protein [Burkholderia latens]KAB0632895.1 hypothetical protein F7R21_28755 [Burkholderia latens]